MASSFDTTGKLLDIKKLIFITKRFSWMDEGITDPDKPLYEATAKLYCRLCDVHKINDWEAHIFTNKHSHNKYRYKTFYRICCGLLSGFLIGVGAFLIIAI